MGIVFEEPLMLVMYELLPCVSVELAETSPRTHNRPRISRVSPAHRTSRSQGISPWLSYRTLS